MSIYLSRKNADEQLNTATLILGKCEEELGKLPDQSVDFIFTDLPYGTTQCKWDTPIDLDTLWKEYRRIIKEHGCIALWAQAPFDKILACSNLQMLRYEWIIEKSKATGFLNSKKMPLKAHENILIFYKKPPIYHPQMTEGHAPVHSYTKHTSDGDCYGETKSEISGGGRTKRYPRDVLKFAWDTQKSAIHPTQKPVEACKYMIRTYTDPGALVLDSCMGSGTTGVAALEIGRNFIGIEKDREIYKNATKRIEKCM